MSKGSTRQAITLVWTLVTFSLPTGCQMGATTGGGGGRDSLDAGGVGDPTQGDPDGTNDSDDGAGTSEPQSVGLELITDEPSSPVFLTHAGDDTGRLFIVDQVGRVLVVATGGALLDEPFLDLSEQTVSVNPGSDERGLLGLAFHPDYAENGRFFVRYSAPPDSVADGACIVNGEVDPGCHYEVLAEFGVNGDPWSANVADPESEVVLFRIAEMQANHNAGHVAFGPDGLLYWSLGDGGGANDGLNDPDLPHGPLGNGQDVSTALGCILRIDVDSVPEEGLAYAIPDDNPFADGSGAREIYAYGFRNPYRFSFDDGPGGDGALYVADVGQNLFEEVNVVHRGGNYGWAIREGFGCFDPFHPTRPPETCDAVGPLGEPLLDPVIAYDHSVGLAVIGGFVYRGSVYPALTGNYVFGDFNHSSAAGGRLFFTAIAGPDAYAIRELTVAPGDEPLDESLLGIGRDQDGELYVLTSGAGNRGAVYRMVPPASE